MTKTKQIFIVGSSRSGTTMMGRILDNHSSIFTFKELHFFGTIWTNSDSKKLSKFEQIELLSRLFCIQENGIFNQQNITDFNEKSNNLLKNNNLDSLAIYELFLKEITLENSGNISCEQTPNNIYYLHEILKYFPDAKVINMIRDQRDVLLSQKNKWKRRFLGASEIPLSEAIRSYINYHPILTSKVWNSSLEYTSKFENNDRVMVVKFEQLLSSPQHTIQEITKFIGVEFKKEMLAIPVVGSSTEQDEDNDLIIDISKKEKWKKGGLTKSEIYLSQLFSKRMMSKFSYNSLTFKLPPILTVFYLANFPIKLVLAFILNLKRMGSILEVVKKRFFAQ